MIAVFQRELQREAADEDAGMFRSSEEAQQASRHQPRSDGLQIRPRLWHPEETSPYDRLQGRGLSQGGFSPRHLEREPDRTSELGWIHHISGLPWPRPRVPTAGRAAAAQRDVSSSKRLEAAAPSDECMLQFELVQTDGGEYDSHHSCSNMLQNDPSCYSSVKKDGINIIAKIKDAPHFTMTDVEAVAPAEGFTSPLGQGIVFVSWDLPNPALLTEFDSVKSEAEFFALKQRKEGGLSGAQPVAFFDLRGSNCESHHLNVSRSGRYVLIKLLRAQSPISENIDVQYVGFRGVKNPHSFEQGCII